MGEQQLKLISEGGGRGGARVGSGRKKGRETTVVRIPAEYRSAVLELVAFLDAGEDHTSACIDLKSHQHYEFLNFVAKFKE